MGTVSSEKCIGPITDTSADLLGTSVLLPTQRRQRNSFCHGFPTVRGAGYVGAWRLPPMRGAEEPHQELSEHCGPRAVAASEMGLFFPGLNSSEIHAMEVLNALNCHSGLQSSKSTNLPRKHQMGHTRLHSL